MNNIRKAISKDKEVLLQLYRDFILDMNRYDPDDSNMDDEIISWINAALAEEHSIILISENTNGINGFARVQLKQRLCENKTDAPICYGKLNDLFILPDARRKGIATQLIHCSGEWVKAQQINEIILNVYRQNKPAYKLYENLGYRYDASISNDRIRMKLKLNP